MNAIGSSTDLALAGALMADSGLSQPEINAALARADRLGVDPMTVFATLVPGDPEMAYRRAAQGLGLAYVPEIAAPIKPLEPTADPDSLAWLRTARGHHDGDETLYLSPGFAHLGQLADHLADSPALRARLRIVSPATLQSGLAGANGSSLLDNAVQRLARNFPLGSAHLDLTLPVRAGLVFGLIVLIVMSMMTELAYQPLVLGVVSIALMAPSFFRLWAAFSYRHAHPLLPERELDDAHLPVYTLLIPLRDEAHMVPQIVRAMQQLDYPPEKLDIKFVVESDSPRTVQAVRRRLADPRFSLVVVPRQRPFTKPKAINFALPLARGEHVVVYDAEDTPEPGQLRRAASLFALDPDLECLQAELVIANGNKSWISRMFAAEYAGHFGVLLSAIARAGFPMPLGGTSNHFRTRTLRAVGAWDAFNVTEDADLGIRMARIGLKVKSFPSMTWEEAPETIRQWVNQRSRWMKGWMQTLLVHSARPRRLLADLGWANFLAFYVFVGGMVLAIAMHGLFLVATLARLAFELTTQGGPGLWTVASLVSLLLGYCGAAAVSVIGLERLGRSDLVGSVVGLPAYWLLAWYALVRAAWELLVRPYHWSKTMHKGYGAKMPPTQPPKRRARQATRVVKD